MSSWERPVEPKVPIVSPKLLPKPELLHSIPWTDVHNSVFLLTFTRPESRRTATSFLAPAMRGRVAGHSASTRSPPGNNSLELLPNSNVWFSNAAFVPGGKYFASAYTGDKDVYVWNISNGTIVRKLSGHTDTEVELTVSPGGKHLLSWAKDRTVRLWDLKTGKELRKMEGYKRQGWAPSLLPMAKSFLTFSPGSRDQKAKPNGTLFLWDTETGKQLSKLEGHFDWCAAASFSPDGKMALSRSRDHTVRLWDPNTGKEILVPLAWTCKRWSRKFRG